KRKILYAGTIHPRWKETLRTYLEGIETEMVEIPEKDGVIDSEFLHKNLDEETAAFVVQQPNFWGFLEDVEAWQEAVTGAKALWVQASDPVSLGIITPPGDLGADIAVGELQSLGLPLSFGGPYAGYFACKQQYVRQIPGRVVGKTHDLEGKTGYVLTLQTREQHIRRDKATSNICTNQSLCALGATLYLSLMGPRGIRELARQNHDKAHYLAEKLAAISGVELISDRPFFNEFTLKLKSNATEVAERLKADGILAGIHQTTWTGDPNRLVVCATETKKRADLDRMAESLAAAMG
ncbi:MAG: aminomethyl-transferring glycine dehydrogenase subunit GcvPA, partial [Candidatus Omnitrophica bacterium]|nr:aminomethyl-transferring glycine dehydrogenase subunit GcvPA [Candidatus Omnitrophota bacterium]